MLAGGKSKTTMLDKIKSYFSVSSAKFYVLGLVLIFGGYGSIKSYREIENASPVEYRGKIRLFSAGKAEGIGLFDSNGRRLFSCGSLSCGYTDYKNDDGKDAQFVVKNGLVVEISVDGVKKLTEDMARVRNDGSQFLGVMLSLLGLVFIVRGSWEKNSVIKESKNRSDR
jgi:hypothetical protein